MVSSEAAITLTDGDLIPLAALGLDSSMGTLFDTLSPHARVVTAVIPFVFAIIVRLMFGRSRTVGWLITLATMWFAVNILVAPYSARMRQDLRNLPSLLR